MRVQNENRRDPGKSTLYRRRRRPRGRRPGCREEESGFERERKNTIDSVARRRHVGHRIASQKEGGSPSALEISSR